MTVKEIEGRCWFACIGLLLLSRNMSSGVRRESRVFDCLKGGDNQTCCAVSSSLSAHASLATARYGAAETTYPGESQDETARRHPGLLASRRIGGKASTAGLM